VPAPDSNSEICAHFDRFAQPHNGKRVQFLTNCVKNLDTKSPILMGWPQTRENPRYGVKPRSETINKLQSRTRPIRSGCYFALSLRVHTSPCENRIAAAGEVREKPQ
jgi:hypothetical protein